MCASGRGLGEECGRPRCPSPTNWPPARAAAEQETAEAWELMRWLCDDHFTFLGYREYELTTQPGFDDGGDARGRAGRRARTGLGVLRSDPVHPHADSTQPGHPATQASNSPSFRRPAGDAGQAREHRLLILTKATAARRATGPRTWTTWALSASTPRAT